jgi:hypothetical protein
MARWVWDETPLQIPAAEQSCTSSSGMHRDNSIETSLWQDAR